MLWGIVYRTEIDSQIRVQSVGGSAGHPNYFIATRKDGSTTYYGQTANAQQKNPNNNRTLNWAQSRFEDSVGNYMNYSYTNNAAQGEFRIDRIDYTGNTAAGVSPNYSIEFFYDYRIDSQTTYTAGMKLAINKRLSRVYSHFDNGYVRKVCDQLSKILSNTEQIYPLLAAWVLFMNVLTILVYHH